MKTSEPFSRPDRVAAQIQREVGQMLLLEVRDPLLHQLNITQVKVTKDLGIARVYYLVLGGGAGLGEKELTRLRREIDRALGRATSFMRRELGQRLRLRLTPQLEFYWDDAVEHGRKMEEVFAEIARTRVEPGPSSDVQGESVEDTGPDSDG